MGLMIFILILIGAILCIRKLFISKSNDGSQTIDQSDDLPDDPACVDENSEEIPAHDETWMQGANGEALDQCYEQIRDLFIPGSDGYFKGALSGILYEKDRAKKLEKIDRKVIRLIGHDPATYGSWYRTVYDELLDQAANDPRLSESVSIVMADVQRGDAILENYGLRESLVDPERGDSTIKASGPYGTVKIKIKKENGRLRHEMKNVYQLFSTGLSIDELERKAEILMAISGRFRNVQKTINTQWAEKHALPSLSKFQK